MEPFSAQPISNTSRRQFITVGRLEGRSWPDRLSVKAVVPQGSGTFCLLGMLGADGESWMDRWSGMDRETLGDHLARAEEHVALSEKSILHQRELIAELERQRLQAEEARKILALLEDLQEIHSANVDRLRIALAAQSD